MKILILNGPNINMLGIRQPEIYGSRTYSELVGYIQAHCDRLGIVAEFYQSNHEGELVDRIQEAYRVFDGIVMNAAAYTHTSIAIADAIAAVGIPTVEVHMSDISKREDFRQVSFMRKSCIALCAGHGFDSYIEAIDILATAKKA